MMNISEKRLVQAETIPLETPQEKATDVSELSTHVQASSISDMSTNDLNKLKERLSADSNSWVNWSKSWLVRLPEKIAIGKIEQELEGRDKFKTLCHEIGHNVESGLPTTFERKKILEKIMFPKRYLWSSEALKGLKEYEDTYRLKISGRDIAPNNLNVELFNRVRFLRIEIEFCEKIAAKLFECIPAFNLLGFDPGATEKIPILDKITKSYRHKALAVHPDKALKKGDNGPFVLLRDAYEKCEKVMKGFL